MRITDRDNGALAVLKQLGLIKKRRVYVGIFATGEKKSPVAPGQDLTILDVATWQEFGTQTIPGRPFVRGYVDERGPEIRKMLATQGDKVAAGRVTVDQALEQAGLWIVARMQRRISTRIDPELAPSTIARKGSYVPLINKGQLRSSITSKVDDGGAHQ